MLKPDRKEKLNAVKKEIKQRVANKKAAPQNTVSTNRLKLLITVVNRSKSDYFVDLLQSFDVNMQMVLLARGTANEKMLNLLGLANSEKSVIFSVIQENKIPDAMSALETKFNTIKDGKGVACTVPLSSVIGTLIYGFLSDNHAVKENK